MRDVYQVKDVRIGVSSGDLTPFLSNDSLEVRLLSAAGDIPECSWTAFDLCTEFVLRITKYLIK